MAVSGAFGFHTFGQIRPMPMNVYVCEQLPQASLGISLPVQSYETSKKRAIPFDKRASNDGQFETLDDASIHRQTLYVSS